MPHTDTIVAPITGLAKAAVAVLRVSGPEAWEVASRVFSPWPEPPQPRYALYGSFTHGDDGLALPFAAGHSYTGDETVEFSIHGSPASVASLLDACIAAGARIATPGEFTQRAFLNGRLDLSQAEGVRDTIEAETQAQLRLAHLHREGGLRRRVTALRDQLVGVLASIEASVDFSDEVGELDKGAALATLAAVVQGVEALAATAEAGVILRRGLRIALVGPPNAGKSSLLNALLGRDRAIVTEIPGTTRDFLEERADLAGVPCVLTDTAGLRATKDPVEALGVERSRLVAAAADRVWFLYDASLGLTTDDRAQIQALERPVLVLANKIDLGEDGSKRDVQGSLPSSADAPVGDLPDASHERPSQNPVPAVPDRGEGRVGGQRSSSSEQGADQDPPSPLPLSPQARRGVPGGGGPSSLVLGPSSFETLAISATTGQGLDALVATVRQDLHLAPDTPAVNERHAASLVLAREGLAMAQGVLAQDLPTDLATVGLQHALTALGAITGQTAEPNLIERLFSDFCLGK